MRLAIALTIAAFAIGCADPYDGTPRTPTMPGEQPASRILHPQRPSDPAPSPGAAARRAAGFAMNWTSKTVAMNQRRLARLMTGEARTEAEQAAARLPTDPLLTAPGARSAGTVEAITRNRSGDLLVVTKELVNVGGLTDERFRITLARAKRVTGGWLLSRWARQP
jgi:hypothetical protein